MTINNNLEIRSDLTDISNTVKHLYVLSNYFEKRRRTFEWIWYPNNEGFISSIYITEDDDFTDVVERLYQIGESSARTLAYDLPLINEIEVYPIITDYIDRIEAYRENWKKRDRKLIKKCEKIILQRTYKLISYWNIEEMLNMHKDTLRILENIERDLNTIRNSKKYKIENIISIEETLKNKKKITDKQNEDYKKYEYKCKDWIYIPGTSSFYRSNEINVNDIKINIGDSLFLLLLRLAVELKKGEDGWVNIHSLVKERIITDPDRHQIYSRLRTTLQGSLIDKDAKKFIENDGSKNYRLSTHPDFITYNKEKLLNHKDPDISKLAEELPNIN